MTPEEEQIINETCQKAADRIEELEAQLSSKEQELKALSDNYAQLWGDWNREQFSQRLDEIASIRAENEELKEVERMQTEAIRSQSRDNDVLRKRCEDLEAALDRNGLSWTYKKLSQ